MKLYGMKGACSLASHIALIWAGAPYDSVTVAHDAAGMAALKAVNPKGAVPALVLDGGAVLTESLAVLGYIADRFPDARLGPAPGDIIERARMAEALASLVSDVHKAWAPFFAPARFVTDPAHQDEAKHAAFVQIDTQYTRLNDAMTGDWMLFGRRTVADAYLYVMCRWKDLTPTPLSAYPALAAFKTRLDGDPGVQRALQEEG